MNSAEDFITEPVYECFAYNVKSKKFKCKYEDDIVSKKDIVAKEITNIISGRVTYQIKTGLDGRVFDPNAVIQQTYYNRGESYWKLKVVKKELFDTYLKYLDTGNKFYLVRVEREVLNG